MSSQLAGRSGSRGSGSGGARARRWLSLAAACAVAAAVRVEAADPGGAVRDVAQNVNAGLPVEASADHLTSEQGIVEGRGNVVIRQGTDELRADFVRYDTNTGEARAFGNVIFRRPGGTWTGQNVVYNFKTGEGSADRVEASVPPFRLVDSGPVRRGPLETYTLEGGRVTTCTNDHPGCHFHIRCRELEVAPDDYIKARGATWYFGKVPVFYFPYWKQDVNDPFSYRGYPGYDSKMGAFLLNAYKYPITDNLKGVSRLDYRTRRGVAVGQDLRWNPEGGPGDLKLYYAHDQEPVDEDDAVPQDIDSNRYRLRLRQDIQSGNRDLTLIRAEYLSDVAMLEDFFESDFRQSAEPDNFVQYAHRGDGYNAGVLLRSRLNDFYEVVERLPELSLDVQRQEVAASSIYYEGQNSAGFLRRSFADSAPPEQEDYDAFRFDTLHMFYRPSRYWGFLNLIPRAGLRGTYYSTVLDVRYPNGGGPVLQTNMVTRADGRQDVVVQEAVGTNAVVSEAGSAFRTRVEVGAEASFKAYRPWESLGGEFRHVLEPYANYTVTSDPNVESAELYQFDEVDELAQEHWVRLGMRNKLQQKTETGPADLVDADVYTVYRIERAEGEDAVDDVFFDLDTRPAGWLALEFDGWWSLSQSQLERLNSRVRFAAGDAAALAIEYRRRAEESDLVSADLDLLPGRPWAYNLYSRYEIKDSQFEEQGFVVRRNLDCMSIRAGLNFMPGYTRDDGSEREDEVRVIFGMWLTAFPETAVGMRHMK